VEIPKVLKKGNGWCAIFKPAGFVCQTSKLIDKPMEDDELKKMLLESRDAPDIQQWVTQAAGLGREHTFNMVHTNVKMRTGQRHDSWCGLAHRLDRETSGILMFGCNEDIFGELRLQCQAHEWNKQYICLVCGLVPPTITYFKQKHINAPLNRKERITHGGKLAFDSFVDHNEGLQAETFFWPMQYFKHPEKEGVGYTLCRVRIIHGRTHQIRVHMAHVGFPLVGDFLYAAKYLHQHRGWCDRVFLHHENMQFPDPNATLAQREATLIHVSSPMPLSLTGALRRLRRAEEYDSMLAAEMRKVRPSHQMELLIK
jgi:23S rRNA-/tRNA-specific pseudouridylate synthase